MARRDNEAANPFNRPEERPAVGAHGTRAVPQPDQGRIGNGGDVAGADPA
jgi:hypothetical protein